MKRHITLGALVLAAAGLAASAADAQVIMGGEINRQLRPGYNPPNDGMSWSHWYNYEIGPQLYLNGDRHWFETQLWLDRQERISTFGEKYVSPSNPHGKVPLFNRLFGHPAYAEPVILMPE